jgi:PAS domain S-box-containing protein
MVKKQTHKEIEQRRKKALEKVEGRLHYLLSTSPAVTYTCEPAGDYTATFISENVTDQLGYQPDEFVEDPEFWVNHIHPHDRRRVINDLPVVFEHGHYVHEYRFKHKDGKYRWMRDELRLVRDSKGNPTEIVGYWIDITERRQAEEALKKKEAALKAKKHELQEVNAALKAKKHELQALNTALRVLLKGRDKDKAELEEKVLSNVQELVTPYIHKLRNSRLDMKQTTYVNILESNLTDIISPFVRQLSLKYSALTPKEIQVAQLIREGRNSREIAELLNSSKKTIESHRQGIRIKLGMKGTKGNLRSFLSSM